MSKNDEIPQLSSETLAVLQEFYKEQEDSEHKLLMLGIQDDNLYFPENWVNKTSYFFVQKCVTITYKIEQYIRNDLVYLHMLE